MKYVLSYRRVKTPKEGLRDLGKEVSKFLLVMMILATLAFLFVYLASRAADIGHDNYCAVYTTANYCK